jgi:putative serine protease PepD
VVVNGSGQGRFSRSGTGSGIVISQDGHILTNNHVVAGAGSVVVHFSSGEQRNAQVVGTDRGNDLALLKVDLPANTPVAPLGDSDQVQVGDTAIAIGSPFGLEATVTQGIISAVHRDWQPQGSTLQRDLIQTDAPINPGNSGGALLNANGEVIGITTAIESPVDGSVGVGFAVPVNQVRESLPLLSQGKTVERPFLGIEGKPNGKGVEVAGVTKGSSADGAGVTQGDVITSIAGRKVLTVDDIAAELDRHKVGDKVDLTVTRDGAEKKLSVEFRPLPPSSSS